MTPASPVIPSVDENQEIVYAENQPGLTPLPSLRTEDGIVLSRWVMTAEERKQVAEQGYVYVAVAVNMQATVYAPGTIQPMLLTVEVPPQFAELAPKNEHWQEEFEYD